MSPVRAAASAVTARSPSSSTAARSGSVATLSPAWRVCCKPDLRRSRMARFPKNDIIALIGEMPRYDLGESVGPDLRLSDVLDPFAQPGFAEMALGYGTAQGDPRLRALIARAHDVSPEAVVLTVGGMHSLFLIAFVLCNPGDEAVTVSPMFPLARNTLEAVGAKIRTVSLSFDRGYQLDAAD